MCVLKPNLMGVNGGQKRNHDDKQLGVIMIDNEHWIYDPKSTVADYTCGQFFRHGRTQQITEHPFQLSKTLFSHRVNKDITAPPMGSPGACQPGRQGLRKHPMKRSVQ